MPRKTTTKPKKASKLLKIIERPVWAQYADKSLVPKYIVHRFDDRNNNRFYYFIVGEEVVIAVGVTTAFGLVSTEREAINRWKDKHPNWKHLLNVSSEYGTLLHILFASLALGHGVKTEILDAMKKVAADNDRNHDMPIKDTLALMKFQEDYQLTPLLVEAQLCWQCPKTGQWLAMTIDLLAKVVTTETVKSEVQDGIWLRGDKKGQPKMITVKTEVKKERLLLGDLKSNFFEKEEKDYYETHKLQLMAGARAVEQMFGIKVDGIFNFSPLAWRTKPGYTFFEHEITDDDLNTWDAYWNLIVAKKLNVPKGNILIASGFKNSDDFQLLSYQDYAKDVLLPKSITK